MSRCYWTPRQRHILRSNNAKYAVFQKDDQRRKVNVTNLIKPSNPIAWENICPLWWWYEVWNHEAVPGLWWRQGEECGDLCTKPSKLVLFAKEITLVLLPLSFMKLDVHQLWVEFIKGCSKKKLTWGDFISRNFWCDQQWRCLITVVFGEFCPVDYVVEHWISTGIILKTVACV